MKQADSAAAVIGEAVVAFVLAQALVAIAGKLTVTELERLIAEHKPKFVYLIPTFGNPSGATLSLERRSQVLEMAVRHQTLIVEDDPYGQLRYEGEHLPPLVLLDRKNAPHDGGYSLGNVIYLSTFSKTLAPGLRLGWMYGPAGIVDVISRLRQPFNVNLAAQIAGITALEDIAHTDASRTNNDIWLPWLATELTKLGLKPLPSVGNFVSVGFGSRERAAAANDWRFSLRDMVVLRKAGDVIPEVVRVLPERRPPGARPSLLPGSWSFPCGAARRPC